MKNEIFVRTDKGAYVGGEVIFGQVFLALGHPIQAKKMLFEIVGYEKVYWEYHETEFYTDSDGTQKTRQITKDRKAHREFFKDHFSLIDYPGGFPAGTFSYPFQYRLPENLPGVFEKKRKHGLKMKLKIRYKIKAIVEIPGIFNHDLKVKQHLIVHERLDKMIEPKHYSKEIEVRTLCCIPRGKCRCEAWMDKNAYMGGETSQVHVKVENQSQVEVTHFNTKLIREITMEAHGHKNKLRDIVAMAKYPGTPALTNKSSDVPLPLVGKKGKHIQASTSSTLIKCEYFVMIELSIPWAPDLEIFAPVKIYEPLAPGWAQWQPPQWIAQAQVQQVNASISVPAEILQSRLQGGYFHAEMPSIQATIGLPSVVPSAPVITVDVNLNEKSPLIPK